MNILSKIKILGFLVALAITSCAKDAVAPVQESQYDVATEVSFDAAMSEDCSATKTTYDAANHIALWKREDQAGVIASYGSGSFTDARMQAFNIENKGCGGSEFLSSATFTGTLTDKGSQTYTYYVVYPYTAFQTVSDITAVSSRLEERQYPDQKSWDGACDMLVSKPVTAASSTVASENLSVQFSRLFGMLRLRFGTSVTDTYGSEIVETISVESAGASDKLAGKFTMDLSSTSASAPVMSTVAGETFNKVTLDYRGRNASLSAIDAYFVVNPGTYASVTITVRTADHTLTFQRTNLTVTRGNIASATLNWKSADVAATSTPLLPKNPETLKIMTFGHSYVMDSMEYMDELLNTAGVKNVTFANFYIGNCSLQTYWGHVQNEGNTKGGTDGIKYYKRYYDGSTVTTSCSEKTVIDALCDEKWDVVVFQTSTEKLGHYDDFKDYLANMISYVKTTCQTENGKTPVLVWHMFWAYGSKSSFVTSNYDGSQDLNYAAHVQTAKQVMRNHDDIQLIIPTGTAIQSLRRSSLNNAYPGDGNGAYDFLRDGTGISHMDYMAGRYTCACTWFEFFLKPCFGITVLGNTYMPPTTYAGVKVTEENRETLQRAAVLACQSPFELSHLDQINPMDVNGSTESFDVHENVETESFNLVDNLNW